MQFLNNKRPPAAKPERQLVAGLRPFNPQLRPVSGSPLKRLCKSLSINSVKPSQTMRCGRQPVATTFPLHGAPTSTKDSRHPICHSSFVILRRPSRKNLRTNPRIPCQIAGTQGVAQSPFMYIPSKRRKTYCHAGHYLLNQAR